MGSAPAARVLAGSLVLGGVVAGATIAHHVARRRPLLHPWRPSCAIPSSTWT
ncbi:MAG: hypothetical protein R2690_00140 [Acidimicrobiales bacterium]